VRRFEEIVYGVKGIWENEIGEKGEEMRGEWEFLVDCRYICGTSTILCDEKIESIQTLH
jgi:hypothetical protein